MIRRNKAGRILPAITKEEILQVISENQPITVSDIARITGIHRETAKKYIIPLLEAGFINAKESGNSVLYSVSEFPLINSDIEEWESVQFWESDPMANNGNSLQNIYLYVDWQAKTAEVETAISDGSIPENVYNGLAYRIQLPYDTDFKMFPEFYRENIKPTIMQVYTGYTAEWGGSNQKGKLTEDARETLHALNYDIHDSIPRHDTVYAFDLIDAFESSQNLIDWLARFCIDFKNVNLGNDNELTELIRLIEENSDVAIINMSESDYKKELMTIQENTKPGN